MTESLPGPDKDAPVLPFHYTCALQIPPRPLSSEPLQPLAALPQALRALALRNSHEVHRALRQRAVGWG
jgi:hypothetical protein